MKKCLNTGKRIPPFHQVYQFFVKDIILFNTDVHNCICYERIVQTRSSLYIAEQEMDIFVKDSMLLIHTNVNCKLTSQVFFGLHVKRNWTELLTFKIIKRSPL